MKNPLNKRILRSLKQELGVYLTLFLFMAGAIAVVSGFLVAGDSMFTAYEESFERYNIEDGNFELSEIAEKEAYCAIENADVTLYENFYVEEQTQAFDSTIRIFKLRNEVNLPCLMEGDLPQCADEIALDRMYAQNNSLSVGESIAVGGRTLKITGLVALPDYSSLFSSPSDMMFNSLQFGVAVVDEQTFNAFGENHLHYSYSWKYLQSPEDDAAAADMADELVEVISENAQLVQYIPQYSNQAIRYFGDDSQNDEVMEMVLLYIIMIIIAFVFAITTSNTISKESTVIGTLRASGFSRGELLRHYLALPLLILILSAIAGNILGYTVMKDFGLSAYYGSYSLVSCETIWNFDAFIKTTIVPIIIMLVINTFMLARKLTLPPLKFLRRDLKRKQKKKAFKLNTKIAVMKRFRLRIVFQNLQNYITIIVGILFANVLILFGFVISDCVDNFEDITVQSMICNYQYTLKLPQETQTENAQKACIGSLEIENDDFSETAAIYGISEKNAYINADVSDGRIAISSAFANKYDIDVGDSFTLNQQYTDEAYTFTADEIYDYPSSIAVFMSEQSFIETFDLEEGYFNAYLSDEEITDIDDIYIASVVTQDDLTKICSQLRTSMGSMMMIFSIFGLFVFVLVIYLLSKIIIEKNAQSISMTKILGFADSEINGLYIFTTSIVVIASLLLTLPIANKIMERIMKIAFGGTAGYLPYYVEPLTIVTIIVVGIASYGVIALTQVRKIKKVPLDEALKNVE